MRSVTKILALILGLGLWPMPVAAGGGGAGGANAMIMEEPPPVHHFFDAKNVTLQLLNVSMLAADVISTRRALQVPGAREANPLAQSQVALLTLKFAGVGAGWGLAYAMHKSGHHKAERFIPVLFGAPSAVAALHNKGIR
jgi:hypothetical protein